MYAVEIRVADCGINKGKFSRFCFHHPLRVQKSGWKIFLSLFLFLSPCLLFSFTLAQNIQIAQNIPTTLKKNYKIIFFKLMSVLRRGGIQESERKKCLGILNSHCKIYKLEKMFWRQLTRKTKQIKKWFFFDFSKIFLSNFWRFWLLKWRPQKFIPFESK